MATICFTQETPANALVLNKDHTQVITVGRNTFKIYAIDEQEFRELFTLRVPKNLNLNLTDVAWSNHDESIVATSATNGAVVIWNVNKQSKAKQEHVYSCHPRTVNRINFHPTEPFLLLSGCQDGSMKCFDLRTKEAVKTFSSNNESIRDVQFNPFSCQTFAAVSDNGKVQLWDVRKTEKSFQAFAAHGEPVFTCDWHPDTANCLATASRDKSIKVWDLTSKPTLECTIHTMAPVSHVKWRPQRKYQMASCALTGDCNISVWDMRRPFIPFATFEEHKEIATAIAWKGDPHSFLSTGRDSTLYRHGFKDAVRPVAKATIQAVCMNKRSDVTFASKLNTTNNSTGIMSGLINRKTSITSDNFYSSTSTIQQFTNSQSYESKCFVEFAKRYILQGRTFDEICDHNAQVARSLGKTYVYITWKIIKTIYGKSDSCVKNKMDDDDLSEVSSVSYATTQITTSSTTPFEHLKDQYSNNMDSEFENEDEPPKVKLVGLTDLTSYQPGAVAPRGDFIYGENDLDTAIDKLTSTGQRIAHVIGDTQDWILPNEAFTTRPPLPFNGLISNNQTRVNECNTNGYASNAPLVANPVSNSRTPATAKDLAKAALLAAKGDKPPIINVNLLEKAKMWNVTHLVVDKLQFHAEFGDMQTAVSVLIVLNDKKPSVRELSETTQEHWFLTYLDELSRHKLWNVMTLVMKKSKLPSVHMLNQQSTTFHTSCGKCLKPLKRSGWLCDKCHSSDSALCCVCHQLVKGVYAWCNGCSHGGHVHHLKQWLQENRVCATGCGHLCEYST